MVDALGTGEGGLSPFVDLTADPALAPAQAKAKAMAQALESSVVPLASHPNASLRGKAIVFLSRRTSQGAEDAVVRAASDPDEAVQRIALSAIGAQQNPQATVVVGKVASTNDNWAIRILATQALGRLGAHGKGAEAAALLRVVATKDSYALVREAALLSLATFDTRAATEVGLAIAKTDPEPRVRETATRVAAGHP